MTTHRRDPYLWIHLAGLATVPIWLDVCLVGLAVGDPIVPPWLELTTLGWVGTVPVLWMQLQRPFYIFSVPGLAVRPDKLTEDRRRSLSLMRSWVSRLLVGLSAIALFLILYWLYQLAPVVSDPPFLTGKSRATGWLVCAIAFFMANLFAQVPATVIHPLLTPPQRRERISAFDSADILHRFTVVGLRVNAILPALTEGAATDPTPEPVDQRVDSSPPREPAPPATIPENHSNQTVTAAIANPVDAPPQSPSVSSSTNETESTAAPSPPDLPIDPPLAAPSTATTADSSSTSETIPPLNDVAAPEHPLTLSADSDHSTLEHSPPAAEWPSIPVVASAVADDADGAEVETIHSLVELDPDDGEPEESADALEVAQTETARLLQPSPPAEP